jgi:hypothetical protein
MSKPYEYVTDLFQKLREDIAQIKNRLFTEKPKLESSERPEYSIDTVHKNSKPEKEAKEPQGPVIRARLNLPETIAVKAETQEREKPWKKDRKFLLEIAAIAVGASVALIYAAQLCQMIKQNRISRDSLEKVQRAFVSFSPDITNLWITDTEDSPDITAWRFQVAIRNSGATTTRRLQDHIFIKSLPGTIPDNFDFHDLESGEKSMVAPQDHIFYWTDPISVQDMAKPGEHTYLYGWATYNDVFEGTDLHITKFCYEVHPVLRNFTSKTWISRTTLCPDHHNCTDDDCKAEK